MAPELDFDAEQDLSAAFDAEPDAATPVAAPAPEPSFFQKIANALTPNHSVGAGLNKSAASVLQAASGGTAHRWMPHVFAAMDEGREMLNAASPMDYDRRVERHRAQWNRDVDPTAVAMASVPLSVVTGQVAPAANSFGGLASLNLLQSAGNMDRMGGDILSLPGAAQVGGETAAMTAFPYALKGAGWAAGKAADIAAPVARTLRDFARGGYVKPTPEATRLMDKGLNLTLGYQDPGSPLARFEEIAANNAAGSTLANDRKAIARNALDLLIGEAAAPGAMPPTAGAPIGAQVKELKAGYTRLYDDALKGVRISPDLDLGNGLRRGLFTDPSLVGAAKKKGLFELAADGVRDAPAHVKRRAIAWLEGAAETRGLAPYKSGPDAGDVDAASLQKLRTSIGDELRALGEEGEDRYFRKIYEKALDSVSEILHTRLPPAKASTLNAVDGKYRDLLAVEDAATSKIAHRNEGEFTADNLLDAIWRKEGASEGLKRMALDVRAVTNPTYPKTGVLPGAAGTFLEGKYVGPMYAKMANYEPGLRAHALGGHPAPAILTRAASLADLIANAGPGIEHITSAPLQTATTMRTLGDLIRASGYGTAQ